MRGKSSERSKGFWVTLVVSAWFQVKSSEEAVILCKTSIGSLKLEISDLPATKVRPPAAARTRSDPLRAGWGAHLAEDDDSCHVGTLTRAQQRRRARL